MTYRYFEWVLLGLCFFIPLSFITTYAISVQNGDITPYFPYISDTGTLPTGSCFFGQFLDVVAIVGLVLAYVRYLHVEKCVSRLRSNVQRAQVKVLRGVNRLSLLLGVVFSFGATMVGNFQETTFLSMHLIGAGACFIGLLLCLAVNTFISMKLSPSFLYSPKHILGARIVLLSLTLLALLLAVIFSCIAIEKFDGANKLHWQPTDGGYFEHVISSVCEWGMAMLLVITLSTFYTDFRRMEMKQPEILLIGVHPPAKSH